MHMPSLRELQSGVMQALLDGAPGHAAPFITAQGISAAHALSVYANTARTNFIESVISSFPAVRRLVGEDYFQQCALGFHNRHPSLSGDLQPAGTRFAQYLLELHGDDEYRYLSDVARLEWLVQQTLLAADHGALDVAKLKLVAPTAYDELHFHLHPSVRLFAADYPCLRIWEANVGSDAEPEPIDLAEGPDRLLLVRSNGQLQFHRLIRREENFLLALQAGEPFAAAVDSGGGGGGSELDAAAALQRFVLAGVIVDFQ
jgi:hypothetical protein